MFPKIVGFPPKSSSSIGFSIINHPFWGTPIFGNTHIIADCSVVGANYCAKCSETSSAIVRPCLARLPLCWALILYFQGIRFKDHNTPPQKSSLRNDFAERLQSAGIQISSFHLFNIDPGQAIDNHTM